MADESWTTWEDEETVLGQGLAIIGFRDVGDLTAFKSFEEVIAGVRRADPARPERRAENRRRQLWVFREGEGRSDRGYKEATGEPSIPRTMPWFRLDLTLRRPHDEITAFVRNRFPGYELARLIEAIFQAEGYLTHRSPPGPDGGADILAGRGPLGLDLPTPCVQVKATDTAADALQGAMSSFAATQGLLVC
jgi:predicted Mrr-cat superfamily restriction endonuclease